MNAIGKLIYEPRGEREKEFTLGQGQVTLGRGATNAIVLPDPHMSRVHARIESTDAGYTLTDLGSANGTRVNGTRVENAILKPGDVITLGDSTLRYEAGAVESGAELTAIHSQADLDATLAQTAVPVALPGTDSPHLVVHTSDRTWRVPLEQDAVTIGRAVENDIDLEWAQVSRHHARIERQGASFVLKDLGSRNGTLVGGQRVTDYTLRNGDSILIGPAQLVFKDAFNSEDLTIVDTGAAAGSRRPPVIIIPGLLGSELWAGSTRVWPNVRLLFSQPELFRLPEKTPLEARGLIGEVVIVPNLIKLDQYNRLSDFLEEALGYEKDKDLFEFGYDWRQDMRLSAQKLAESIERWNLKPPIILIGHSLGTLVARYYVEQLGGKSRVGRLVLMGTPNPGNPRVLTALVGGTNLLPFGILGEKLRSVLATFPSLYQALPTGQIGVDQAGNLIDFMEDMTWLDPTRRDLLAAANEFKHQIGFRSSVPTVCVFGYGIKTMTGAKLDRDAAGLCRKLDITIEPKGDDSIPESSGILEGSEIHPVQQYHGSLYVDNDVKMRLKLELTRDMQ